MAPTTVIQNSYRVSGDTVTGTAGKNAEIDGGHDVTVGENGSLGYPYLSVAPGILDLEALTKIDSDNGSNTYSNDDYDEWDGESLTTAVAFSESIDWINSDHTPDLDDVSANNMSSFTIVNNIEAKGGDAGNSSARDFITFDIDNIFTFADSHSGTISFDSIIKDLNGNVADAATVVIRDALPPFIVDAVISTRSSRQYLKITFSEEIAPSSAYIDGIPGTNDDNAYTFRIANQGVAYPAILIDDVTISGHTIEIEDVHLGTVFDHTSRIDGLQVNVVDKLGNDGSSQVDDQEPPQPLLYNYGDLQFEATNSIPTP